MTASLPLLVEDMNDRSRAALADDVVAGLNERRLSLALTCPAALGYACEAHLAGFPISLTALVKVVNIEDVPLDCDPMFLDRADVAVLGRLFGAYHEEHIRGLRHDPALVQRSSARLRRAALALPKSTS